MDAPATVRVERIDHFPAMLMMWETHVREADVLDAFQTITDILEQSDTPMYCVVDLRRNPIFPLRATLHGALFGPYRNPKLKEWLVLGSNPLARTIEKTLSSVTGRKNVSWFMSYEAVLDYLQTQADLYTHNRQSA